MSAIVRFLAVSPRLTVEPPILDKREVRSHEPPLVSPAHVSESKLAPQVEGTLIDELHRSVLSRNLLRSGSSADSMLGCTFS